FGSIHQDHPTFAVTDAPPGDVLRLNAKITDDLVGYHHWDLIRLVLLFTLIFCHFPGPPSTLSGRNEDSSEQPGKCAQLTNRNEILISVLANYSSRWRYVQLSAALLWNHP